MCWRQQQTVIYRRISSKVLLHSRGNYAQHLGTDHCARSCVVAQSCPTLCDPMDCGTPDLPVLQYLPEFAQTHFHRVDDAIQPSYPLLLCSLLLLPSTFPCNKVFSNESAHYNGKEYEKECGYMLKKKSWIHLEGELPFKGVSMLPEKVLSPVNP